VINVDYVESRIMLAHRLDELVQIVRGIRQPGGALSVYEAIGGDFKDILCFKQAYLKESQRVEEILAHFVPAEEAETDVTDSPSVASSSPRGEG
jgi:hypothetical protein